MPSTLVEGNWRVFRMVFLRVLWNRVNWRTDSAFSWNGWHQFFFFFNPPPNEEFAFIISWNDRQSKKCFWFDFKSDTIHYAKVKVAQRVEKFQSHWNCRRRCALQTINDDLTVNQFINKSIVKRIECFDTDRHRIKHTWNIDTESTKEKKFLIKFVIHFREENAIVFWQVLLFEIKLNFHTKHHTTPHRLERMTIKSENNKTRPNRFVQRKHTSFRGDCVKNADLLQCKRYEMLIVIV